MEGKERSECLEHSGEKKKLFCCNPCKISLCQNCHEKHKKHDIRALSEIVGEMTYNIERVKIEKNTASTLCKNQVEAIDKFISEFEAQVKHYEEEEKKTIKVIAEPFNEIVQQYKIKVNEFIKSLNEKKEKCMRIQERATTEMNEAESKIELINKLAKAECTDEICKQWLEKTYTDGFERIPESEYMLDIDTIRTHCEGLKNINVIEQMEILAQFFINALQNTSSDPISELIDVSSSKTKELKDLHENVAKEQMIIKSIITSAEEVKKKVKASLKTAIGLQKKDNPETIKELINGNEEVVKSASGKLIADVKAANESYMELLKSRKEIEDLQMRSSKNIADWKKGIQTCEVINAKLKKQFGRFKSIMDDYGKEIVKLNNQYNVILKDFENLDNKFQALRSNLNVSEPVVKVKTSVISISEKHELALKMLKVLVPDSLVDEEFVGTKSYNIKVDNENDLHLWYLGSIKNIKDTDPTYYQNVEYILLVYGLEEDESEVLKRMHQLIEFIKGKTKARFVIAGITENNPTDITNGEYVAGYSKFLAIPFKVINVNNSEEVKGLFHEILHAKLPELQKGSIK